MEKTKQKLSLNVCLPVYNEEEDLERGVITLTTYLSEHLADYQWTVTIADNASTDKTLEIAQKLAKRYGQVQVLHFAKRGRGMAVKQAWKECRSDIVAYMDVDLSTDLKHFGPLVQSLGRGYDIAIGSRNARGARVYGRSLLRTITSKAYIFLIKCFFFVHFSDAQCGFKAMTRKMVDVLIPNIVDNEWFFDTELLVLAEKRGFRIYEEPVTWVDNPGSTVRVWKTAHGDIAGLWRLFLTRPWRKTA